MYRLTKVILLAGIFCLFSALTDSEQKTIEIYEKYNQSVVNITTISYDVDYFFNIYPRPGAGSGFIYDKEGHIVTNNHVVTDSKNIEVTLANKMKFKAKVVGTDPNTDLAVIAIKAPAKYLVPVKMGDSDPLKVGREVLAIGNPFQFGGTLTKGIISALGRTIRADNGKLLAGLIQTDAAINPGNSGWPLLDMEGNVIGVNTAIISPSGGSSGVGFVIPAKAVSRVVPELIKHGFVKQPFIGIRGQDLFPAMSGVLKLNIKEGVLIVKVFKGSSAEHAGLKGGNKKIRVGNYILISGGDIITSIDGKKVLSVDDISDALAAKFVGDSCIVEYTRDGKKQSTNMKLYGRPEDADW